MTQEADLLTAVLATPEEDEPRLIHADWLLERGYLRGELIVVQCQLAKLPAADVASRAPLAAREKELLENHKEQWTSSLIEATGAKTFEFRRGYVEHLLLSRQHLAKGLDYAFAHTPLRSLALMEVFGDFRPVLALPSLARLKALDLRYQQIGDDDLERLVQLPAIANLEWLGLEANQLGDGSAYSIARSPYLANVKELVLSENGLTDGGVEYLARPAALRSLRTLHLTATDRHSPPQTNEIRANGCRALATLPLEKLMLTWNAIGDEGAAHLANGAIAETINELGLCRCAIGPAGARALASSPLLSKLQYLDLSANRIDDAGAKALLESKYLPTSMRLGLVGYGRYPAGVSASMIKLLKARFRHVDLFILGAQS